MTGKLSSIALYTAAAWSLLGLPRADQTGLFLFQQLLLCSEKIRRSSQRVLYWNG